MTFLQHGKGVKGKAIQFLEWWTK